MLGGLVEAFEPREEDVAVAILGEDIVIDLRDERELDAPSVGGRSRRQEANAGGIEEFAPAALPDVALVVEERSGPIDAAL